MLVPGAGASAGFTYSLLLDLACRTCCLSRYPSANTLGAPEASAMCSRSTAALHGTAKLLHFEAQAQNFRARVGAAPFQRGC